MSTVSTRIDHKLRVRIGDLPEGALEMMIDALSIPNQAKIKARKMDTWGWEQMPEKIRLYEHDEDEFIMPRGFLGPFMEGIAHLGGHVRLVDWRYWKPLPRVGTEVNMRPWQEKQVEALMGFEQGILKAPAGSGKTVAILAAIQTLGCNSIVIVNTKDILWQWQARAETFLGPDYPIGQIGDNKFDVSPYLTIATAQTLHSRYEELEEEGFFDRFSFVCLDECHHSTAETYNRILNRFSSRYRVGVSATPDKTGDFEMATNVLGEVIHEVTPEEVTSLQKPTVIKVPTKFDYRFRSHKNRFQRSNYPEMIEAIVKDPERNQLIIDIIRENAGHHQLLVTKRLEHIQILQDILLEDWKELCLTLTGSDSNEDRDKAVDLIGRQPGILLSTLADEALDIPRLDRMHLVFPQRNPGLVVQQVGRVERKHSDKNDAKIFDYVDENVGALASQWRVRMREVYRIRSYQIQTRGFEHVV